MSGDSLSRLGNDFSRSIDQHLERARASTRGNFSTETVLGFSLAIGDRVLDSKTGQEGEIVSRRKEHVLIPAAGK